MTEIPTEAKQAHRATLRLSGMSCARCAQTIEKGVAGLPGIERAAVNFAAEKLTVEFDASRLSIDAIIRKIEDLGYGAKVPVGPAAEEGKLTFAIQGMHCASCAGTIEKKLSALPGMRSVRINFAEDTGTVEFDSEKLGRDEIFEAVREAGYTPLAERGAAEERSEARRELFWVIFAAALSFPIMVFMWWMPFGAATHTLEAFSLRSSSLPPVSPSTAALEIVETVRPTWMFWSLSASPLPTATRCWRPSTSSASR
jgi:Cu+-exporting ATPase